jgi:hypothetical protein
MKREPKVPHFEDVLARGGDYQAELASLNELRKKDAQPVLDSLRSAGVEVDSVWDLLNAKRRCEAAIPILLEHLAGDYFPSTKAVIARALAAQGAQPTAAPPLSSEFLSLDPQSESEEHSKWGIGYALGGIGDDSFFDEIAEILRDSRHAWTRSGMIDSLPRMRKRREEAFRLAIELARDEDAAVSNDAMIALGNFRDLRGRPVVESFLQHPDSWVRQKAKQALAKIDRKAGRSGQTKPH